MIRINRGPEVRPGVFSYAAVGLPVSGASHQPLLDACRQIASLGVTGDEQAAIYREGRSEPDMTCSVADGARTTVSERDRGVIRFREYRPFAWQASEANG